MVERSYVITTAQRGATPHKEFLLGLEQYAKKNNSEILILPTNSMAPQSSKRDDEETLHPDLANNYQVVDREHLPLGKHIAIQNFPVQAQQMDPVTSLDRFVGDEKSAIFASPKQRMRVVPNDNNDAPKVLMTTGACTLPHYQDTRRGTIATRDHVFGAITLTVDDEDGLYHYRQLRANKKGDFHDLDFKYSGTSRPKKERVDTLVMGDYHCRENNPEVLAATYEMIKQLKPKRLVLHDFFDGFSISHHDQGRYVRRGQKAEQLDLREELYDCGEHLQNLRNLSKDMKIYLVKSNHDEVLDRWLQECRFVEDPHNMRLAADLLGPFMDGFDPLKEGIEQVYGIIPGVTFLTREDNLKRFGWQLANHGDLGANGARAGATGLEKANAKQIVGHSHSPQIQRNFFQVGTSSHLMLDYNRGPSSWLNTHALLYGNGQPTLINVIDGKWK